MLISILKSKIHRVTVTDASLHYVGSITIDKILMDAAGLYVGEKVLVVNHNNGERFETYVIEGAAGTGTICINGPAARKVVIGDKVIVIAFGIIDEKEAATFEPKVIFPDEETNRLK